MAECVPLKEEMDSMEKFKVVERPSGETSGICYADSFPLGWKEVGKRETFEECLEHLQYVENFVSEVSGDPPPFVWSAEHHYTKQIVIFVSPYGFDDEAWTSKKIEEESAYDYIEQWRQEYATGLTHVVIGRNVMSGGGDASNFRVLALPGPIPDGWHFASFAGTEEECRREVEKKIEIEKRIGAYDPYSFDYPDEGGIIF